MKFYDLHCDTISAIYELRKQGKQAELSKNSLHLGDMGCRPLLFLWTKGKRKTAVWKLKVWYSFLKRS